MKRIQGKTGQTVTIYEDPIMKRRPEGKAKLIQFKGKTDYAPYAETWVVKFTSDPGYRFTRTIVF